MGLFDAFKRGLQKTRDFWSAEWTKTIASHGKFDEDMLDEFEEIDDEDDGIIEKSSLLIRKTAAVVPTITLLIIVAVLLGIYKALDMR